MPSHLKQKVLQLFQLIDTDGSKTIDREETLRFWSKNFPKLNSNELFDQVDKNNDGSIQLDGNYIGRKYNVVGNFITTLKVEILEGKNLSFVLYGDGGTTISKIFELSQQEVL